MPDLKDFQLKFEPCEMFHDLPLMNRIIKDIKDISGVTLIGAVDCIFNFKIEWKYWDNHLRKLSLLYPELLFIMRIWGEYHDDLYKCYAKNGKLQFSKAEIIFDDYDVLKLE